MGKPQWNPMIVLNLVEIHPLLNGQNNYVSLRFYKVDPLQFAFGLSTPLPIDICRQTIVKLGNSTNLDIFWI